MNAHQHYNLLMRTPRALALKAIIAEVVRPGMKVLDAGCGSGLLSIWAAQAGATVVGVDFADLTLANALAAENGVADRITFIRGDLHQVGLEQWAPFDVLLAMVYLNDPRRDEQASALVYQLKRYLAPNAVLVPDHVVYTAEALDCPGQDHAVRMAAIDKDLRGLEEAFGLRMDTFRQLLAHRPSKEAFPSRDGAGVLDLGDHTPLSAPVTYHVVQYSGAGSPMPGTCTFPITANGRLTAVRWGQELRFRDRLIFRNASIGWVHPTLDVTAGTTLTLRTDDRWRADNLLSPA
jgi:hypothetical protein